MKTFSSNITVCSRSLSRSIGIRTLYIQAITAIFLVFWLVSGVRAQLMINKGATIVTKPGSFVQINGAYQNNTGSIDDSGVVTITTDFENDYLAIAGGSGWYNIGGDYTNGGLFNIPEKTGTVNLDGSSNQNVGGDSITTFYNLQFTNGGSKTLTEEEMVDSNCYFTNGICYTTQPDVLHFTTNGNWVNNAGLPVAPAISYVDGPCEKATNSTDRFWFPVGKSGRGNTCAITPNSSTPTTYRTQYFNYSYVNTTDIQSPLVTVSKIHYWHGDIVSSGGSDAIIRLYWIPGDYTEASYMSDISGLVVARWDTLAPDPPGPTPAWVTAGVDSVFGDYNSGWIESALVVDTDYGTSVINRPFTIGSLTADNSLPVEMGPFTAHQVENHVELDWKTYSEIQSLGFELDRAPVGGQPEPIQSFANTPALQAKSPWGADYQTIDNDNLTSGRYTYSLYQIDKDGIRTSAGTQTIDFSEIAIPSSLTLSVYPNPITENATIEIALPRDAHVNISIYDITGRLVESVLNADLSAGPHLVPFDASSLARGQYNVIVNSPGQRMMHSIVLQ